MTVGVAVLVVLIGLGIAGFVVVRSVNRATHRGGEMTGPPEEELRYVVPTGQDPAVLLAALHADGYDAVTVLEHGRHVVVVSCPAGADRDRAHVRAVIRAAAQTSLEGEQFDPGRVEFEDEAADGRPRR